MTTLLAGVAGVTSYVGAKHKISNTEDQKKKATYKVAFRFALFTVGAVIGFSVL